MQRVRVIIYEDTGELEIITEGFKGDACLKETKELKDLLGEETARQLTPAFYGKKENAKKWLPLCG